MELVEGIIVRDRSVAITYLFTKRSKSAATCNSACHTLKPSIEVTTESTVFPFLIVAKSTFGYQESHLAQTSSAFTPTPRLIRCETQFLAANSNWTTRHKNSFLSCFARRDGCKPAVTRGFYEWNCAVIGSPIVTVQKVFSTSPGYGNCGMMRMFVIGGGSLGEKGVSSVLARKLAEACQRVRFS
jgi:hypothetical protein